MDRELIDRLQSGCADLTLKGKDGKTPPDLAKESGDEKTILILREGTTKWLRAKMG